MHLPYARSSSSSSYSDKKDDDRGWHYTSDKRSAANRTKRVLVILAGFILVGFVFLELVIGIFHPSSLPHSSLTAPFTTAFRDPYTNPRVAILTLETRQVSYWFESLANKYKYARRHGYDFEPFFELPNVEENRSEVWTKITLVNNTINDAKRTYDWIMWLDFDTLFTNLSVSVAGFLEDVLPPADSEERDRVDMILAPDCQPINAGVILFRAASPWTQRFLNDVWSHHAVPNYNEQDAMREHLALLGEFDAPDHLLVVPQSKLNAYPQSIQCHEDQDGSIWSPGMWIVHFPVRGLNYLYSFS